MGDILSILTDGWFQTDGEVPEIVEVMTFGVWNVLETIVAAVAGTAAIIHHWRKIHR